MRSDIFNINEAFEKDCLEELREFLQRHKLFQYYDSFDNEGFDRFTISKSCF